VAHLFWRLANRSWSVAEASDKKQKNINPNILKVGPKEII